MEFLSPNPALAPAASAFFRELVENGDAERFHPHPFTDEAAERVCKYAGQDVYCFAVVGSRVIGYGMLRGWDQGYAVPSLGIAMGVAARGMGLGRAMMHYLHAEARRRGAERIRLKVYPENKVAVDLYRSLGYEFTDSLEDGQLVGYMRLASGRR